MSGLADARGSHAAGGDLLTGLADARGSHAAGGDLLTGIADARCSQPAGGDALNDAVWDALEPRTEDVIGPDLNRPDHNAAFRELVTAVAATIRELLHESA